MVLADLNGVQAKDSAADNARYGCEAYNLACEVSKPESVEAFFRFMRGTLSRLDIPDQRCGRLSYCAARGTQRDKWGWRMDVSARRPSVHTRWR